MKLSLGKKTALLLVAFGILFSMVSILDSWQTIDTMSQQQYKNKADELAATVARVVNTDDVRSLRDKTFDIYHASESKVTSDEWGSPAFNAYVDQFEVLNSTPEFGRLLEELRRLQEVNSVNCLYLIAVEPADEVCIYLLDATLDPDDLCPTGCLDPLYDINKRVLSDPMVGFPAYITNTEEYGWLVTAAAPIVDEKTGEMLAYAAVDISMHEIREQVRSFVWLLAVQLFLLIIGISVFAIWLVNRVIVHPINLLSKAATHYGTHTSDEKTTFESLEIHTGDEVESLYHSMVQMERDIETHIDDLIEANTQLVTTRLEAQRMNELANKDALTGIRNKMAYEQEKLRVVQALEEGDTKFGVVMVDLNDLKHINDTYGHDCGDVSIVLLSTAICETFEHSPVFRVGGDEFVAIVRGKDYLAIETLYASFKDKMAASKADESREPWERISAAIGYALFNPLIDHGFDDVFKRADRNMYDDKVHMKSEQ